MSAENKFSLEDILEEERRARAGETVREEELPQAEPAEAPAPQAPVQEQPSAPPERPQKPQKEKRGLFGRRKKQTGFDESEDMYYGLQLKPIDEYTRGFDATGEISLEDEGFKKLFDQNTTELDDEVAQNFARIQQERRRRVADAVENVGGDLGAVEDELGIVAPVPVSAFAGDPYAKQHGIEVESGKRDGELPQFQRAMLDDAQARTMEIKLDVASDTLGIQQAKVVPEVSEDSVRRILEAVQENKETPPALDDPEDISSVRMVEEERPDTGTFMDVSSFSEEKAAKGAEESAQKASEEAAPAETEAVPAAKAPVAPPRISMPVQDVTQYRKRDLPVHIINADVLQSALLSEARSYTQTEDAPAARRLRVPFGHKEKAEEPDLPEEMLSEELDDFTGPQDAKSVSHDLRTTMRELTLRMMATGISTVVLVLAALICEAGFGTQGAGGTAIGYTIVSMIFLLVAIGFCVKTITNGLRALFEFRANSDSAAAVAAVAVLIQTVCALFFSDALAAGEIHLYAGMAAGILFVNTLGKLMMQRRIHSNFRFVASREPKYAVRIFDDYNASLKLAGSSVVSQPTIAYQQKTGFLKRFLQISYEPDPAETASQALAPVGLVSSLLLCVVALIITKDAALAITAFAASCCVCVAVTNMLGVNLSVSRLSRVLRRAGAMVSGFEGVKRMSAVNAVLVDSAELFPRGTVVLNGVKPFDEANLEEAVLAAGALMQQLGGPLCGVFEQVFSEHEGELPAVGEAQYDAAGGVVGTVDGKKLLIGGRTLLTAHGIEAPEAAEESRYTTGSKQVLYVAREGVLCAMLILTYNADRKKKAELQALESNGVSLLVRSTDVNLTPRFIAQLFGIDASVINVIGAGTDTACDALLTQEGDRVDAYTATKGRVESMMRLVSACISEKRTVGFIVALQNAAVVIGFVLVAFLTFVAGVSQISGFALLLYELFWLLAIVIVPKIKDRF